MTRKLWYVSLGCATSALLAGYALGESWIWALPILGFSALWLLGQRRGLKWVPSLGLLLFIGLAAIGLWLTLAPGLMLLGMIATLAAWDLENFLRRVEGAERVDHRNDLERRHLRRLLMVEGSGTLLAVAALSVDVNFGFGSALLLGLLAIVGLSRTIGFLRRESD
ncbi:MAG TPA: DUF4175 domain-containing protein [Anaerolineae bacterium]|nr:DUF4175 domain-containing protein [Anaerolineae bacterium]